MRKIILSTLLLMILLSNVALSAQSFACYQDDNLDVPEGVGDYIEIEWNAGEHLGKFKAVGCDLGFTLEGRAAVVNISAKEKHLTGNVKKNGVTYRIDFTLNTSSGLPELAGEISSDNEQSTYVSIDDKNQANNECGCR